MNCSAPTMTTPGMRAQQRHISLLLLMFIYITLLFVMNCSAPTMTAPGMRAQQRHKPRLQPAKHSAHSPCDRCVRVHVCLCACVCVCVCACMCVCLICIFAVYMRNCVLIAASSSQAQNMCSVKSSLRCMIMFLGSASDEWSGRLPMSGQEASLPSTP